MVFLIVLLGAIEVSATDSIPGTLPLPLANQQAGVNVAYSSNELIPLAPFVAGIDETDGVSLVQMHVQKQQLGSRSQPSDRQAQAPQQKSVPQRVVNGVTEAHHESASFHFPWIKGTPLKRFVDELKGKGPMDGETCLTIRGGTGGLANDIGFINMALQTSMRLGLKFVLPSVLPSAHDVGDSFKYMFGQGDDCKWRSVEEYSIDCGPVSRSEDDNFPIRWQDADSTCTPSQFVVSKTPSSKYTHACGCERLLAINVQYVSYNFNYAQTRNYFAERYWKSHNSKLMLPWTNIKIPGSRPPSLVMHVRLGDVENVNEKKYQKDMYLRKHTHVSFYMQTLHAVKNVLPHGCFHLIIVTDGSRRSDDIQLILQESNNLGIDTTIYDNTTAAVESFEILTHADVLVAGGSGFSRLAAVLMPDRFARIVVSCDSHPLGSVPNTTKVAERLHGGYGDLTAMVAKNEAVQALKKQC